KKDKKVFLKDIPINSYFNYGSNRIFKKNNKLRKRYLCQDIISGREFLFSPIAEVKKYYDKSCS
ncbi:MAG: sprT domain-containing protein, partial [Flavobacteriales bacterium]|nr:sprT domain-containing protein [Flavobacteriales bacterium]